MTSPARTRNVRHILEAAVAEHSARRLRAFLYQRTSSDPYLHRTSTRDQESVNRRTCDDNGWDVAGVFEDSDKSASRRAKKPRPDFEAMVAGMRNGECDVLVFCDASRMYRDLEVYMRLRKLCLECHILLCYNGDIYDMSKRTDRKRSAQDAVQAEDEADQISERVLRTKREAAERGAPVGLVPFGFRREYDPKTGRLIGQFPHPPTADLVREAAGRVLSGEKVWSIAKDFQARGIPCAHGSQRGWEQTALKRILINPANIAKRVHQRKVVGDAAWEPILDEDVYYACRKILTDPQRRTQRGTEVKYLLSGIAVCHCGGLLRPRASHKRMFYACIQNFDATIALAKCDAYVLAVVLAYLERPEFVQALSGGGRSDAMRAAVAAVAELESELEEARRLVGQRKLSVTSLAAVEHQLLPQLESAKRQLEQSAVPPLLRRVAGPDARQVWAALDLLQQREVIRALVGITLNRVTVRGRTSIEEGRITFDWKH